MFRPGPLVGRQREIEVLNRAFDEFLSGCVRTVVIEGEPGIGKTRLAAEAVATAEARGLPVLAAVTDEIDRARPFGPLLDALERAGFAIAPLGGTSEFACREAITDQFEEVVSRGPAILLLEDAQWADSATIATLPSLTRRLAGLPLLVIVTCRLVPHIAALDLALHGLEHIRLSVGPLNESDACALLENAAAIDVPAVVRRAGGNPFFMLELAGALSADTRDVGAELPPSVGDAVFERLKDLAPDTIDLVRTASVLGTSFSLADVSSVSGRPAAQLLPALTEAIRAGVLGEQGDRLGFRHDLVREAAYVSLPRSARAALHRDAAHALDAAGAPVGRVAAQFALAAEPGDTEAVNWLRRAAADAAHTPGVAAETLQQALELTEVNDPAAPLIAHDLAYALEAAGRLTHAESTCRAALEFASDVAIVDPIRLRLIHSLVFQGRGADVLVEVDLARERQFAAGDAALIDAYAAMALVFNGDMAGAEAAARAASEAAPPTADAARCFAEITLSVAVRLQGRARDALAHAQRAVDIASRADMTVGRYDPEHFRAMCLIELGDLDACATSLARGRRHAERMGLAWNLPGYHYLDAQRLFLLGEWDDALAEFDAGLSVDADVGSPDMPGALAFQAQIYALRGDIERAQRSLDGSDAARAAAGSLMGFDRAAAGHALVAEGRGDADPYAALDSVWSALASFGVVGSRPDFAADLVRAALARGDMERARAINAQMADIASVAGSPLFDAVALHCSGLTNQLLDQLVAARLGFAALGLRVLEVRAVDDTGTLLSVVDPGEARRCWEEALAFYEKIGARHDAARVVAALRSIGVRRGSRARRARATTGWDSLTPTELAVVQLVRDGLTTRNIATRLYISPHTVTTHVKHIFAKLGFSSRVELAAAASRRPADEEHANIP